MSTPDSTEATEDAVVGKTYSDTDGYWYATVIRIYANRLGTWVSYREADHEGRSLPRMRRRKIEYFLHCYPVPA